MKRSVEERLAAIEARNAKVEQDKAWETSWTRRISITILTYAIIALYLVVINNDRPLVSALIPAIGYLLSTLVLKSLRDYWNKRK